MPVNALQLFCLQYSHIETLQQTFCKYSTILDGNGRFAFLAPFGGAQRQRTKLCSYLRLIGKRVFRGKRLPISTNWTFFRQILRLRRYKRISIDNRRFCSNGASLPQHFSQKGHPHQPFFLSVNQNDISCGITIWVHVSFVLSQSTRLTDRQREVPLQVSRLVLAACKYV